MNLYVRKEKAPTFALEDMLPIGEWNDLISSSELLSEIDLREPYRSALRKGWGFYHTDGDNIPVNAAFKYVEKQDKGLWPNWI